MKQFFGVNWLNNMITKQEAIDLYKIIYRKICEDIRRDKDWIWVDPCLDNYVKEYYTDWTLSINIFKNSLYVYNPIKELFELIEGMKIEVTDSLTYEDQCIINFYIKQDADYNVYKTLLRLYGCK